MRSLRPVVAHGRRGRAPRGVRRIRRAVSRLGRHGVGVREQARLLRRRVCRSPRSTAPRRATPRVECRGRPAGRAGECASGTRPGYRGAAPSSAARPKQRCGAGRSVRRTWLTGAVALGLLVVACAARRPTARRPSRRRLRIVGLPRRLLAPAPRRPGRGALRVPRSGGTLGRVRQGPLRAGDPVAERRSRWTRCQSATCCGSPVTCSGRCAGGSGRAGRSSTRQVLA